MRKRTVVESAKAPAPAVTAELRRLRTDGRIVSSGRSHAARWSLPQFQHVIVADVE